MPRDSERTVPQAPRTGMGRRRAMDLDFPDMNPIAQDLSDTDPTAQDMIQTLLLKTCYRPYCSRLVTDPTAQDLSDTDPTDSLPEEVPSVH